MRPTNKQLRMHRLWRGPEHRLFVVPMDHSISDGPIGHSGRVDELVGLLARHGADAVVLHKGRVRTVDPRAFADLGLILHLSAGTSLSTDPDTKVLVCSVEEAVRLGADAVSVHVNIGSNTESQQLRDAATVADACDRWGMPLLAMMYARGSHIVKADAAETVAHLATIATDIGADIVKTLYTGDIASMREVADTCSIPLIVAGGPANDDPRTIVRFAEDSLAGGVSGLAIGRNIFRSPHPEDLIRSIVRVVRTAGLSGATADALESDMDSSLMSQVPVPVRRSAGPSQ